MRGLLFVFIVLIASCTTTSSIQDEIIIRKTDVPKIVADSCKQKYPTLAVRYWMKTKKGYFKAGLQHHQMAMFTSTGNWYYSTRTISTRKAPALLKTSLQENGYRGWKINECSVLIRPGKEDSYIFEVEKGADASLTGVYAANVSVFTVYMNADGSIWQKEDKNPTTLKFPK